MSQAGRVLHLYVEVRSVSEEEEEERGDGTPHSMLQCPDVLPHCHRSSSPNHRRDLPPGSQHQPGFSSHSLPTSRSPPRHSVSFQLQNPDAAGSPTRFHCQDPDATGSPIRFHRQDPDATGSPTRFHRQDPDATGSPTRFHRQDPDAAGSPTRFHRQDLLHDSFSQLLQVLAPGTPSPCHHSSSGHTQPPHMDPYRPGRMLVSPSSTSSGTITAPNTPTSTRRSYEGPGMRVEEGKTSVVTFGYVEKANVRGHQRTCQSELGNRPNRMEGQLRNRFSDPLCYNGGRPDQGAPHPSHPHPLRSDPLRYSGQPDQGDPYPSHPHPFRTPQGSPYLQRASQDPFARDATFRASEEFGSPELGRRLAGPVPDHCSPTLPRHFQSSRCRSLGGSPVLPRSAHSLPSKTQFLDRGVSQSLVNGLPRTPAHEQLYAQSGYHSMGSTSTLRSRGDESPRLSSKFHPPLPAGRPTDIQHEIPTSMLPPRTGYQAGVNPQNSFRSSYSNLTDSSHNATDGSLYNDSLSPGRPSRCCSPTYGRRNLSKCLNANVASKLAAEATKRSTLLAERRPPSPASSQAESRTFESPKRGGSFLRESQPFIARRGQGSLESLRSESQNQRWKTDKATPRTEPGRVSPLLSQNSSSSPSSPASSARLNHAASQSPALDPRHYRGSSPSKTSPVLHHYQPPLYTGDHTSIPALYDDLFAGSLTDSPELSRRCPCSPNPETVSWPPPGNSPEPCDFRTTTAPAYSPSNTEMYQRKAEGMNASLDYQTQVRSLSKSEREEGLDHSGGAGTSSQSSSGVTGSMGDSQLDRNESPSPETSSQCSHDTADTGSGIQSDGSSTATPSSRSQRIAQAKWDFLFGGPPEESRCRQEAPPSTPPPRVAPSPAPRSSLRHKTTNQRRGRDIEAPKVTHHKVCQIEVELVTSDLRGSAPKTGIIRQTIKYSETDLDAVPLRCYRETDLDEVMRAEAEAEAAEEADSDFGSHLGNSFSPPNASPKPRRDVGRKEEEEEEEEEEEDGQEEEGVVSWASVRMLGDRQKQKVPGDEDEVFSLLLKGALSESHGGLKSPISLGSPRRPSESNLDSFSRHFETIMESHRAKGTSYSSLDSVDLLTSGSTSVFTFDLPTLTPEIQSQICDSAKQILELSFAPLAHPEPPSSRSDSALSGGAGPFTRSPAPPLRADSQREAGRRSGQKEGFRKTNSAPSLHGSPRERPVNRAPELLYPQADVAERLALGGEEAMLNGTKADLQAAKRLAKRLFHLDGFRKSDVARHLGKNNDFSQMVAEEYLSNFDFSGLAIDQALRLFLSRFALIGETQERERVLAQFSRRYRQSNTHTSADSVHTLTCAVMLLNSDLHGNNVGKRMSCSQFINNLEGLNEGKDFPRDLLKALFSSIKNEKLQWTIDEEDLRTSLGEQEGAEHRKDSASLTLRRTGGGAPPNDGEIYKSGFLVRKVHADPDGKRTPRGKRGWKSFYATLKGLVLYLQKDEFRADRDLSEEDARNAVSIHHSLAMRAADYSKRPNVFYLRTADWRVFLLQAPTPEQMQSWITRINVVAAMFSAPPFPAAIGSQKRFSRPLLPGSKTKLTQEEQLKCHEGRFRSVSSDLSELSSEPDRKVKGREMDEQKLRQEYLEFEKTRYGTYSLLLRARLAHGDEDLSAFEARLLDDGLQRAHSSPTLPQEPQKKSRGHKTSRSLKGTSCSSSADRKKNGGEKPEEEAA